MSMYGDYYANYPQQWRRPQGNYWAATSDSPPPVPILAITAIIIFFLYMSQFGFTKVESHSSRTEVGMYMFIVVLFLIMVYVAWCMLWDSFNLGIRPSNWYGQHVNGVGAGGSGWSVVIVVATFALLLVLAFDNPVLSIPVAFAGACNMLAAFY